MRKTIKFLFDAWYSSNAEPPRGRGSWAFVFGKADYQRVEEAWFTPGGLLFSEAKALAANEAALRGVSVVGVLP